MRRTRYGISAEDYSALLAEQGNACGICRKPKPMRIDHDHKTKQIRGLLCGPCNAGLGALGDTIDGLRRALSYLENVSKPQQ